MSPGALKISLDCATFFGGGAVGPFSLLKYLLERDAPYFGEGIKEIGIKLICFDRSAIYDSQHYINLFRKKYDGTIDKPAKYNFDKKSNQFKIQFVSKIDSVQLYQLYAATDTVNWTDQVHVNLLSTFTSEVRLNLRGMESKIRDMDNFDLPGFLSWVDEQTTKRLPKNGTDLTELLKQQANWGVAQFLGGELSDATSDVERDRRIINKTKEVVCTNWDFIDVDWNQFHVEAKQILDDPFYWSTLDANSPHGNDEGADLLSSFQRWRKKNKNKNKSSQSFLEDLLLGWGLDPEAKDPFGMADAAIVGLAFAHLKVDGGCPADVKQKALEAIENQFQDMDRWVDPDERKQALEKMKNKLLTAPELILK